MNGSVRDASSAGSGSYLAWGCIGRRGPRRWPVVMVRSGGPPGRVLPDVAMQRTRPADPPST